MAGGQQVVGRLIATLNAKISTKVPQCWEKGETTTVIAELDVLGANRFRMGGATLNIDQVRDRLASFIARGDSLRRRGGTSFPCAERG